MKARTAAKDVTGIGAYVLADYLTALLAWAIFFVLRKRVVEQLPWSAFPSVLVDSRFLAGVFVVPLGWLLLYYLTGTYTILYLKSRIKELGKTFFVTLAGVVFLFFIALIDDVISSYQDYYVSVMMLFTTHFVLTSIGRLVVLSQAKRQMRRGKVYFPTLFIGGNKRALEVFQELNGKATAQGYRFLGYVDTALENNNGNYGNGNGNGLSQWLPRLGTLADLERVIAGNHVRQVVVAIETSEHHQLRGILNRLADRNVIIKIVPDMYDILSGAVRMNHLQGAYFIEIYPQLMARWQYIAKRIFDISVSVLVLVLLSPLYVFTAIRVKLSSPGPIFYSQERIGLHGKPFRIYKFRSMYVNAESNGPQLSSHNDPRVTPWGRVMRKWRLDELPQFYNVLKGEMSIVGPRPERKYYIDQILSITTDYRHLHRVKPGITSLGMVKFGYAENIQQMITRMKYDLLYIENMSLLLDLKILFYTLRTILQGRGR
ncbi:MAG: sugar transferase [Chitinophagales bacterium]|nr:sugar transferase [Chitinophagales bacterium]MDW8428372.1 sugar transferase [Chitinophagales bacterium]